MKAVIAGNGAAALGAIEAMRGVDGDCEITLLSKEIEPAYTPCFLSQFVAGDIAREKLYMRNEGFYESNRIDTLLGVSALGIDPEKRTIGLSNGTALEYDTLLLAAGSSPIVPKIEGVDGGGVFYFRTLADSAMIRKAAGAANEAVVMGAGFIGLEIAEALVRLGLKVTVVEKETRVLPRMLDMEIAALVESHIRKNGVDLRTGRAVRFLERSASGDLEAVTLDSGERLACGMLVVSIGVKPNIEMLDGAVTTGLGVLVNERMEASAPGVYAAGDIAEVDVDGVRKVNPIHVNAVKTGMVAGWNMAGADRKLAGHVDDMNVVTLFGLPILSLGAQTGARSAIRRGAKGVVKIHELEDGRIGGVQLVGDVTKGGLYLSLMKRDAATHAMKDVLAPRFNYGATIKAA